jgi:hypothetical protein
MPLLDHFHPPLSVGRHWESFLARWTVAVADGLNESLLPAGYFAEIEAGFPAGYGVRVFAAEAEPTLVAAVELVSPANKDAERARHAFAARCASYLQQGTGLVVVDIVTSQPANMHDELTRLLGWGGGSREIGDPPLEAVGYRPAHREGSDVIDVWPYPLAVGEPLVVVPLALSGAGCMPLDLEASYTAARRRSRLE